MSSNLKDTVVPRLSADDIEGRAEEIIAQHSPANLTIPTRTPILELIEQAISDEGLLFDATQDLGMTKDGRKILGMFQQSPLAIRIDAALADDDTRFRFTAAHEYGHFILHRQISIGADVGLGRTIRDTAIDFSEGRKALETPRDWIEWQANHFAAAILMPRTTVKRALMNVQTRIGITNNKGQIFLEHKSYSYADLNRQLAELCLIYLVSKSAMQNRLDDLGILVDRRDKGSSSFSTLFGR